MLNLGNTLQTFTFIEVLQTYDINKEISELLDITSHGFRTIPLYLCQNNFNFKIGLDWSISKVNQNNN